MAVASQTWTIPGSDEAYRNYGCHADAKEKELRAAQSAKALSTRMHGHYLPGDPASQRAAFMHLSIMLERLAVLSV